VLEVCGEGDHCYAEHDSSGNARTAARKLTRRCATSRRNRITILAALNLDFDEWGNAFPNNRLLAAATIDRLRHNAYCLVIEGKSNRDPKVAPPAHKSPLQIAANRIILKPLGMPVLAHFSWRHYADHPRLHNADQ